MSIRINVLKAAIGLVFAIATASAHSASLFSDDFNRTTSSTVNNGWSETPAGDISIVTGGYPAGTGNNAMRLMGNPHGAANFDDIAAHVHISTTGFNTISFSFDWRTLEDGGAPDKLVAGYSINGGTSWINLTNPTLLLPADNQGWFHTTYSLSPNGDNQSNLGIRFATLVNNSSEGVKIDNVSVTGVSAIPEPETYAMMLAGLGLMGFMARRRKEAAAA